MEECYTNQNGFPFIVLSFSVKNANELNEVLFGINFDF